MKKDPLIKYIERNHIQTPIKLGLDMIKLVQDKTGNGKQKRYMRVYISNHEVTTMVANFLHRKLSKAKDTYGCLILTGCGMDMFFSLQSDVWRTACQLGYKDMFDDQQYENLYWKRTRPV